MSTSSPTLLGPAGVNGMTKVKASRAPWWRVLRQNQLGLWLSVAVVVLILLVSLLAPLVAPFSPTAQDLVHRLAGPSGSHLLGTDAYGRDVLSRLMYGGRSSYEGVGIAVGEGLVLGIPWGLAAGYWPRFAGSVLMRIADAFLAFPALVLAVAITGVLGPNLLTSMSSVGIVFAPIFARLMRNGVLELRRREFVLSARLSGCPARVVLARHILPRAIGPVVVQAAVFAGLAFIIEAALSFLGLGIQPPAPSWGGDLADAYQYILRAPRQVIAPGVLIAIVVLCVYRIGDAVRDRFSAIEIEKSGVGEVILA